MMFAALPSPAQDKAADPFEVLVQGNNLYSFYHDYDEDGDGKLDTAERAALTRRLLRDFDLNGDKTLDERELLLARAFSYSCNTCDGNHNGRLEASEREALLTELTAIGDLDDDGKLSLDELRLAVGLKELLDQEDKLGWANPNIPPMPWLPYRQETQSAQKLLALLERHYDSVRGRQVDLAALEREITLLQPFDALVALWPEYDVDKNQHWDKAERARLAKDFPSLLDLNGDGAVSAEELQEVGLRFAFKRGIEPQNTKAGRQEWLTPEASRAFDSLYLTSYDTNRNGRWEPKELKAGRNWELLLPKFFYRHPEFDLDGDKKMSPPERATFMTWLIENRDAGTNGALDPAKMDVCFLDEMLLYSMFPDPEKRAAQRAKLLAICDLNHNGRFETGEARIASWCFGMVKKDNAQEMAQLRDQVQAEADHNHDGVLDPREAERFLRQEAFWTQLVNPFRAADLDRDGWFCPQERAALTQAWLKECDRNGNGHLELCELQEKVDEVDYTDAVVRSLSSMCGDNGFMVLDYDKPEYFNKQLLQREFATRLCDIDGDGWLDAEELEFLSATGSYLSRQGRTQAFRQLLDAVLNNPPEAEEKKSLAEIGKIIGQRPDPQQMQKARADADTVRDGLVKALNGVNVYDTDRDGILSAREIQVGVMLENALREFLAVNGGNEAAAQELDRNGDKKIDAGEWRAYITSLLPDYDANHNGRIEAGEMAKKIAFELLLLDNLGRFQIPRNAKGQMDAAGRKAVLERLAKRYDLNGDGKVDLPELQQKHWVDGEMFMLGYLYPEFEPKNVNDFVTETKRIALEAVLVKEYDTNHDGRLDLAEFQVLFNKHRFEAQQAAQKSIARQAEEHQKAEQEQARLLLEQARRQQEARWLRTYDFNGNGKLDPEERTRAEADAKAGIQAPARDE
jgi:Ca2+-binding EF-hand superfamily protein